MNIKEFDNLPKNKEIYESFLVANSKINNSTYNNIACSVSGGADSDVMIDLITRVNEGKNIKYVFFDTGLEYKATKDHLTYLEEKYKIKIDHERAKKSIPTCCKEYGQPFLSKQVSEMIGRLQRHNFQWEDQSYDDLVLMYPKCEAALRWWCNAWGEKSHYNIDNNKYLKEFMLLNHPQFKISNKCCHYAKKMVAKSYKVSNGIDLNLVGIRKAEGGARSSAYKNCFTLYDDISDEYRPIFWYKNETKEIYDEYFNVKHSECYSKYGLKRTGCAGCPYNREFEFELEVIREYETNLYIAINNIFGKAYEYTRKYNEFKQSYKKEIHINTDEI